MTGTRHKTPDTRQKVPDEGNTKYNTRLIGHFFLLLPCVFCLVSLFFGCASVPKKPVAQDNAVETRSEQLDAVQKVMGAMGGGRDVTTRDMRRVVRDIRSNQQTRSAVEKIIGADGDPVVKYSPVTGKHYSGDLEYDPETGVKLEVLPE